LRHKALYEFAHKIGIFTRIDELAPRFFHIPKEHLATQILVHSSLRDPDGAGGFYQTTRLALVCSSVCYAVKFAGRGLLIQKCVW